MMRHLLENHFHLLVRMFPEDHVPDADLSERYRRKYGEDMGVGRRERLRCYREFVYETGAVDTKKGGSLDEDVVRRERSRNYVLGDVDLFRYRCRNFVDSGVLGSKKFVEEVTEKIRHKVPDRKKRTPHRFKGLGTICTMKRLAPEL